MPNTNTPSSESYRNYSSFMLIFLYNWTIYNCCSWISLFKQTE